MNGMNLARLPFRDLTRRGSAATLVFEFRKAFARERRYGATDFRFKLECFDLDEAICVMERLTAAEHAVAFVTWLRFGSRRAAAAPKEPHEP